MIDTNVYLSRWPFRRLYGDTPQELMAKLNTRGVSQAWAGSFDALLHNDLGSANARLAADCRRYSNGSLLPFGSVNPALPDWKEELRRCAEDHRMPGIRLHPNYHRYKLDDPAARELMALATQRRMIIQIAVQMEDERTQHPLVQVPNVFIDTLPELVSGVKGLRLQILNARTIKPPVMRALLKAGEVYFDFAMIEGVHGLERLVADASDERVAFGSYFPFYYWEAAHLKVKEAAVNPKLIFESNARRLLGDLK
jgi:uncharacterized protein